MFLWMAILWGGTALSAAYMYFFFIRLLRFFAPLMALGPARIAAGVLALVCAAAAYPIYYPRGIVLLFFIFSGAAAGLINLLVTRFAGSWAYLHVWSCAYRSGLAALLLTVCIACCGCWNATHAVFRNYSLETDKPLPGGSLRVVSLPDIHMGTAVDDKSLADYCRRVEALKPDLVVVPGDLFDEGTTPEQMRFACKTLGAVKSRYGTYFTSGNHDLGIYGPMRGFTTAEMLAELQKSGVKDIDEQLLPMDGGFVLAGRADYYASGGARKTTAELLNGADRSKFILLLDHQPRDLKANAAAGADLQLSGHTHKGQLWPFGFIGRLFNEMEYGYRRIGGFQVIVSAGVGCWGFPFRTSGRSEIVVVDVRGAK